MITSIVEIIKESLIGKSVIVAEYYPDNNEVLNSISSDVEINVVEYEPACYWLEFDDGGVAPGDELGKMEITNSKIKLA